MSPFSSKYPSGSGSPRSSVARDSETRARENTRRRPAHATLEENGRKSNHEGREAKASGVPDGVEDKIGILGSAHSGRESLYMYLCNTYCNVSNLKHRIVRQVSHTVGVESRAHKDTRQSNPLYHAAIDKRHTSHMTHDTRHTVGEKLLQHKAPRPGINHLRKHLTSVILLFTMVPRNTAVSSITKGRYI